MTAVLSLAATAITGAIMFGKLKNNIHYIVPAAIFVLCRHLFVCTARNARISVKEVKKKVKKVGKRC